MEADTADAFTVAHAHLVVLGQAQWSIDAAVMALLDGSDLDAVAELAGAAPSMHWSELQQLVARVHEQLGLNYDRMSQGEAQIIVLRLRVVNHRSQGSDLRALTRWAHDSIGHGSDSAAVERVVQLEDDLDMVESGALRQELFDPGAVLDAFLAASEQSISRWRTVSQQ